MSQNSGRPAQLIPGRQGSLDDREEIVPTDDITLSDGWIQRENARRAADRYADGRVSLTADAAHDQVILARRRRSWSLTMPTASSLSQSMRISEHLELSTSPSVRFTCPVRPGYQLSGIVVRQAC